MGLNRSLLLRQNLFLSPHPNRSQSLSRNPNLHHHRITLRPLIQMAVSLTDPTCASRKSGGRSVALPK
jgi:hypothetical protein